jgi:general secretion pathway protein L
LLNSVKRAIVWFLDGLAETVIELTDRLQKRAPVRLIEQGGGAYALQRPDGRLDAAVVRIAEADGKPTLQPLDIAQKLAGADVDVVLPNDELLIRTLDPLPAESRQYLDGIVRHQLERLVPWRADNVLYSYDAAPASDGDGRLIVKVAATARSLHAPLLAALSALSPRRLRLLFRSAAEGGGDIAIPLDRGTASNGGMQRLRYGIASALAALLLISAAAFGYLMYSWQQVSDALAAAETSETALRKQLGGRGPQETAASRDLRAILERKKAQPLTVLAIDALSNALPEDTWLTELQVVDGLVRISGVSRSVADLVPNIQGAPIFADSTFFSPTTRLTNGQGDSFHLQMRLVPPRAVGK